MDREQAINELIAAAQSVTARLMALAQTGRRIVREDIQVGDLYYALENVKRCQSEKEIATVAPARRGRRAK